MGYHTAYNLSTQDSYMDISEILRKVDSGDLGDDYGFEGLNYALTLDGDCEDSVNWYNHEDDMRGLSEKFPDVVFCLHGQGEDNDDMWYKYFKNGKMQSCYAKITYDDYDKSKLE